MGHQFNGGRNTTFGSGSAFTAMLWANWTGGSGWESLISLTDSSNYIWYGSYGSNLYVEGGGTSRSVQAMPTGWHHYALTWNGSTARAYLDGTLVDSWSMSASSTKTLYIGNDSWGDDFVGVGEALKVFDAVLTAEQIQTEMPFAAPVLPAWAAISWQVQHDGTISNVDVWGQRTWTGYTGSWSASGAPISFGPSNIIRQPISFSASSGNTYNESLTLSFTAGQSGAKQQSMTETQGYSLLTGTNLSVVNTLAKSLTLSIIADIIKTPIRTTNPTNTFSITVSNTLNNFKALTNAIEFGINLGVAEYSNALVEEGLSLDINTSITNNVIGSLQNVLGFTITIANSYPGSVQEGSLTLAISTAVTQALRLAGTEQQLFSILTGIDSSARNTFITSLLLEINTDISKAASILSSNLVELALTQEITPSKLVERTGLISLDVALTAIPGLNVVFNNLVILNILSNLASNTQMNTSGALALAIATQIACYELPTGTGTRLTSIWEWLFRIRSE